MGYHWSSVKLLHRIQVHSWKMMIEIFTDRKDMYLKETRLSQYLSLKPNQLNFLNWNFHSIDYKPQFVKIGTLLLTPLELLLTPIGQNVKSITDPIWIITDPKCRSLLTPNVDHLCLDFIENSKTVPKMVSTAKLQ